MPAPKRCCVPFCNSNRETKVSFHEFPSDIARRNAWLMAIDRDNFRPSEYSKVCSYHFQECDFVNPNRHRILKKNAIPSIFAGYPTFITDKNQSVLITEKSNNNKSQNKINVSKLSHEHSLNPSGGESAILVRTSKNPTSEKIQTQNNLSATPSPVEIKSSPTNQVGSQFNLGNFCTIVPKQSRMTSCLMEKNIKKIYVLNVNKTITPKKEAVPTVIKEGSSSIIDNGNFNHTLLKRKTDVNNFVVNKMLKISPPSKNKAVSLLRQLICTSNKTRSVIDIEKSIVRGSPLPYHQLSSQGLPSDGAVASVLDSKEVGSENERNESDIQSKINISNVPSNRLTEIKHSPKNVSIQAGVQTNLSNFSAIAAKGPIIKKSLPQKYFNQNAYSSISELRHKNKNMISLLCKKNKKIKSLEAKLEEMSEKLEYFENNDILKKVEKMLVISNEGLATNRIKFLLNQISNLDKKCPRWPNDVLRECVLLRASSPKSYEALQKSELFKLPKHGTLMKFAPSTNSQTRNHDSSWDRESEEATEIVSCESEIDEDIYFDLSNSEKL